MCSNVITDRIDRSYEQNRTDEFEPDFRQNGTTRIIIINYNRYNFRKKKTIYLGQTSPVEFMFKVKNSPFFLEQVFAAMVIEFNSVISRFS